MRFPALDLRSASKLRSSHWAFVLVPVLALSACTGQWADPNTVERNSTVAVATGTPFFSYNDETSYGDSPGNTAIVEATKSSFNSYDEHGNLGAGHLVRQLPGAVHESVHRALHDPRRCDLVGRDGHGCRRPAARLGREFRLAATLRVSTRHRTSTPVPGGSPRTSRTMWCTSTAQPAPAWATPVPRPRSAPTPARSRSPSTGTSRTGNSCSRWDFPRTSWPARDRGEGSRQGEIGVHLGRAAPHDPRPRGHVPVLELGVQPAAPAPAPTCCWAPGLHGHRYCRRRPPHPHRQPPVHRRPQTPRRNGHGALHHRSAQPGTGTARRDGGRRGGGRQRGSRGGAARHPRRPGDHRVRRRLRTPRPAVCAEQKRQLRQPDGARSVPQGRAAATDSRRARGAGAPTRPAALLLAGPSRCRALLHHRGGQRLRRVRRRRRGRRAATSRVGRGGASVGLRPVRQRQPATQRGIRAAACQRRAGRIRRERLFQSGLGEPAGHAGRVRRCPVRLERVELVDQRRRGGLRHRGKYETTTSTRARRRMRCWPNSRSPRTPRTRRRCGSASTSNCSAMPTGCRSISSPSWSPQAAASAVRHLRHAPRASSGTCGSGRAQIHGRISLRGNYEPHMLLASIHTITPAFDRCRPA